MAATLSITWDDDLGRDPNDAAARECLDRRNIAAAAAWPASLTGEDAVALAEFDAAR
jgi:hypothetical protein